jgi:hypothetical protein
MVFSINLCDIIIRCFYGIGVFIFGLISFIPNIMMSVSGSHISVYLGMIAIIFCKYKFMFSSFIASKCIDFIKLAQIKLANISGINYIPLILFMSNIIDINTSNDYQYV